MNLTRDDVLSILSYESADGTFRWKENRRKVKVGDLAGKTDVHGYRVIGIDGRYYKAHRLVWLVEMGTWPAGEIDHINGTRSDNRIQNLRDVSRTVNARNQRKAHVTNKTSGLLGVSWHKPRNTWRAAIRVSGKVKFLGYFKTAEEGHAAYLAAKALHHEVPGCKLVHGVRLEIA